MGAFGGLLFLLSLMFVFLMFKAPTLFSEKEAWHEMGKIEYGIYAAICLTYAIMCWVNM